MSESHHGLGPVSLSPSQGLQSLSPSQQGTVELSSLSSPRHRPSPANDTSVSSCLGSCWNVISWTFSIVTYIIELFVYVWASYIYAKSTFGEKYYLFGLSVGYLVFPTVFVATISLVWYYNLDRFHRRRRDRDPHNLEFIEYRKKFTVWALVLHILLLGVVYRYSQLIYLTLIGKRRNIPYLHRDAILVRFFHAFLSSAPHVVLHLYSTIVALTSSSPLFSPLLDPTSPAILAALALGVVSVLYTTLSFATNDRVSGKNRRVVLPAHLTQALWHLCMVTSRVVALAVFAYGFGVYVVAVVGGHWFLMLFLLLLERTTFCADIERQSNGELRFTRRLCLELPFDLVAAAVYVFVYFNPKRGHTRVWAGIYHLVTLSENVTMAVLVYLNVTEPQYLSLPSLTVVVGLYPVGLLFMFCYYLLYHPKKTGNWYWLGFPRRCKCCDSGDDRIGGDGEIVATKYLKHNHGVVISEPTLISHNGYVPKNLLPVGPNAMVNQNETQLKSYSQSVRLGNGHVRAGERSLAERRRATVADHTDHGRHGDLPPHVTSADSSRTNTARTASESNPTFSESLGLELDTDLSSNAVEGNDTVIDTPLFGCTPENAMVLGSTGLLRTRLISQDLESQKTCTNDTGIDVDSDLQLTPGTVAGYLEEDMAGAVGGASSPDAGEEEDEGNVRLPMFVDVSGRPGQYRHSIENNHFPQTSEESEKQRPRELAVPTRESVTPTLPTPTYTPSPTALTPVSTRAQWRHLSQESGDSPSPQRPRRDPTKSRPSPDKPSRKAPRSPIGARSHKVTSLDEGEQQTNAQHSTHETVRAVTPRSPKGARRLLIQQPPPTPPTLSAQDRSRRHAPPPPRPPRTSSMPNGDTLAQSLPADEATTGVFQSPREAFAPLKPIPRAPPPSDGLTRGLSSLVPTGSERRAQSSSPFPASRHQISAPQRRNSKDYRSMLPNPNVAADSPARLPGNYSRVTSMESQVMSGSMGSVKPYHVQPRPKSDGWNSVVLVPGSGRGGYRHGPLHGHGSSPERSLSTSNGQRFLAGNGVDGPHRGDAHSRHEDLQQRRQHRSSYAHPPTAKATPYYSANVPKSAFNRVSPDRHHAQHVGGAVGRGLQQPESYPSTRPPSMSGGPPAPASRSPRRYPKAPQGASVNAPRLVRSPPSKKGAIPPPLPPPRQDSAIDEPFLPSSSFAHLSKHSGTYDKLPADMIGEGLNKTPVVGRAAATNRASFASPAPLRPPQSSTHESVV